VNRVTIRVSVRVRINFRVRFRVRIRVQMLFDFFFFHEGANSEVKQYCTTMMGPGAQRGSSNAKQQNKQSG